MSNIGIPASPYIKMAYNSGDFYGGAPGAGYGWTDAGQGDGLSFNMETDFGSDQQFQAFDYSQNAGAPTASKTDSVNSGYYSAASAYGNQSYMSAPAPYSGQLLTPGLQQPAYTSAQGTNDFEDEPPLLEELGINPDHIVQKTLAVLNPFRTTDASILQDTDLAGPLAFCLAFGGFLLLSGKVHFSYIYGIGVLGCLAVYALLNLMAVSGVSLGVTISVLGYCLLPMVALSGLSIVVSLQGLIGIILTALAVLWCCLSASKLFVTALAMDHQQPLVAYPCALLYAVFALLTIF